jgi:serine phosphatase RsbU (regulator of sigma subunit)
MSEVRGPCPAAVPTGSVLDARVEGWLCGFADSVGAQAAVLAVCSDDGAALEPRWATGYPEEVLHTWRRIDLSEDIPLVAALHGEPVVVGSLAELVARFPLMAHRPTSGHAALAAVAVPDDDGQPLGVLGLSFSHLPPQVTPTAVRRAARRLAERLPRRPNGPRAAPPASSSEDSGRARAASYRLKQLTALTGRLAEATDAGEVASVVADLARSALQADAATFTAYDGHEPAVHLAASGFAVPGADRRPPVMSPPPRFERLALVRELLRTRAPVLVSSRAERDEQFPDMRDNGVTQEAWANLPLVLADRFVGVAAFGWDAPRRFSADDVAFMQAVADHAAIALERVAVLSASRSLAETMQHSLLPAAVPDMARFAFAARYVPATRGLAVGGDWYDVLDLTPDRVAIAVGDVVGHGPGAAAVMGQLRSALTSCLLDGYGPARALEHLDRFARRVPGARVSSVACLLADAEHETLVWACAGHPPPLLVSAVGARFLDRPSGPVLGVAASPEHAEHTTRFAPDDTVVLYTDGLVERRGESIDVGLARLAAAASARRHLPPADLVDGVLAELHDGDGPADDVAVVAATPVVL